MINLTGKQKRFLRSKANQLNPLFSIGKNGVNQEWVDELLGAIDKRELMKVSLQQSAELTASELADYIHGHSTLTVVQVIGKTLVLYAPSQQEKYQHLSKEVRSI